MAMSDFSSTTGVVRAANVDWVAVTTPATSYVPFPYSGQPGTEEVGYGEGGYGEGGYDSPGIPASAAPSVNWVSFTLR